MGSAGDVGWLWNACRRPEGLCRRCLQAGLPRTEQTMSDGRMRTRQLLVAQLALVNRSSGRLSAHRLALCAHSGAGGLGGEAGVVLNPGPKAATACARGHLPRCLHEDRRRHLSARWGLRTEPQVQKNEAAEQGGCREGMWGD